MKNMFGRPGLTVALLSALYVCAAGTGIAAGADGAAAKEASEELFLVNCRQCHGMKGTAGTPLANNAKLEDPAFVATTILEGRGYMTAFADHLDDTQIAALATFVRNSWGNEYGPVTPAEVAAAR